MANTSSPASCEQPPWLSYTLALSTSLFISDKLNLMNSLKEPRGSYTSIQDPPHDPERARAPDFTPNAGFWAWTNTLWSLVLHCLVSLGIAGSMIYYVDGRYFNITERRPWVPLADGTTERLTQYVPLQSDVTTFLSGSLVVLRLIAASWAGSLCWRGAFVLMERTGLRRRDLDWMLSYGIFTPFAYTRHSLVFCIGGIMLVTLFAQATSPLLTGSITWAPSSRLAELASNSAVKVSVALNLNPRWWSDYAGWDLRRKWTVLQAAGICNTAWGGGFERGVLKRVLPSTSGLNINSTIANVTLPYFSVNSLEWILDPMGTLSLDEIDVFNNPKLNVSDDMNPLRPTSGTLAFLPDTAWSPRPFPSPSIVSETRTLVLRTSFIAKESDYPCGRNNSSAFKSLPPTMGFVRHGSFCFAFAKVAYSAGVGLCTKCRLSSHTTVRNDTALTLREDPMTTEALRLIPEVALTLILITGFPYNRDNADDYVIDMLGRSYAGAWTALTDYLNYLTPPLTSTFSPSLPSLQALVDQKRVYAWLGIQMLVTLLGIIFLLMQAETTYRLIGNTGLTAFDLNTTNVVTRDGHDQLWLESEAGELRVAVRKPKPESKF